MKVGLIVAAGKSKRMKSVGSKQYLLLEGRPVLAYSLEAFCSCDALDEIALVVNQEDIDFCKGEIVEKYKFFKVKRIVGGGEMRQDSVANGLESLSSSAEVVAVHDGARPLITPDIIEKALSALRGWDGVVAGVPVTDTIKLVDERETVKETVIRDDFWHAQTPQVFRADTLIEAHRRAKADNFYGTDDASLVERLGLRVKMVNGSYENIKITVPEDLALAEAILKRRKRRERGA